VEKIPGQLEASCPTFLTLGLIKQSNTHSDVYASAIHSIVHCGSAFEPGASGLPNYCTSKSMTPNPHPSELKMNPFLDYFFQIQIHMSSNPQYSKSTFLWIDRAATQGLQVGFQCFRASTEVPLVWVPRLGLGARHLRGVWACQEEETRTRPHYLLTQKLNNCSHSGKKLTRNRELNAA